MTDANAAARAISKLADELRDPEAVQDAYGQELAESARTRGNLVSVPRQAHLVADAVGYSDGRIQLASGAQAGRGTAGELLGGAEYGSSIYQQFGPHSSRGHWLWPTIMDPTPDAALAAGDDALEQLIEDVI